jgi:hypothetical protein
MASRACWADPLSSAPGRTCCGSKHFSRQARHGKPVRSGVRWTTRYAATGWHSHKEAFERERKG